MMDGKKNSLSFNNYPITIHNKNSEYYIECKGVFVKYSDYVLWKKDVTKNILGYNKKGQECKIQIVNNIVKIGCLKDSLSNFNRIANIIKTDYVRNTNNHKER